MFLGKKMLKKIFFLTIIFTNFYIITTRPEVPQPESTPFENKPATKRYIIMFKPKTSEEIMNEVKLQVVNSGGTIYQEYTLFKGFAAEISETLVHIFEENPNIKSIEDDNPG
ncbi:hypothetical protein C1645_766460 [Glomus cerebriforme]|uniref:Inhibitor I9 domain-containing protein n=1 Tax=Glomus cerebriforme TaxID=658196 RepID=A0A397T046_9GLOM|nr:hypothetical protein C1645_766460 [Glomus cerebriforme]